MTSSVINEGGLGKAGKVGHFKVYDRRVWIWSRMLCEGRVTLG